MGEERSNTSLDKIGKLSKGLGLDPWVMFLSPETISAAIEAGTLDSYTAVTDAQSSAKRMTEHGFHKLSPNNQSKVEVYIDDLLKSQGA